MERLKIIITGGTGFVGKNLINKFSDGYSIRHHIKGEEFKIDEDILIHLAGNAHDLKEVLDVQEYYEVNTELTKQIFDAFSESEAKVFITLSSVKAVADSFKEELTENHHPNPNTHYGKSKWLAEQYILSKSLPLGKRVYVLRPTMIYGPGNKGNLKLLYNFVSNKIPWPLGAFENQRSLCSIDNLLFVINELIVRDDIPSGIYNVCDDEPISTNDLIKLMASAHNRNPRIWKISKNIIQGIANLGDTLHIPLNSERLQKLTESYVVSNEKIRKAIGKPLPISSKEGLLKTFQSFNT